MYNCRTKKKLFDKGLKRKVVKTVSALGIAWLSVANICKIMIKLIGYIIEYIYHLLEGVIILDGVKYASGLRATIWFMPFKMF